ncbi:MAG: ATP-binding cassette domain-containing protein, partial [Rectinemataceae bacterium]
MQGEYIEIRGARENNLKGFDIRIPKRKISVFTGVSGSGKSSLVFDTIAAEAQRQLNENFSTFVRGFLPKFPQPRVDSIEGLNMAVIVDQKRLGGGSHSTVGTVTDIAAIMRRLFSRFGLPEVGSPNLFSFNDPGGMCPECSGMGRKIGIDLEALLDRDKSLAEGAIRFGEYEVGSWSHNFMAQTGFFDMDKRLKDYTEAELELLLNSPTRKIAVEFAGKTMNMSFDGIVAKMTEKYIKRDLKTLSERTQKSVEPFLTLGPCPSCRGARLSRAALECRVAGHGIAEFSDMEIDELIPVIESIDLVGAAPFVKALSRGLRDLEEIGLEYLCLSRPTDTLSGGESARVKMVKQLGSSLTDVLYVFDEPSVGLHPRDVHRLGELLVRLRDKGNTVLVVEHDPDILKFADHLVDMGPAAGPGGGRVVYEGKYEGLVASESLTGRYLGKRLPVKEEVRKPRGTFPVRGARANNLRNVDVDIPKGIFTVITGVAGSGKSSLIHQAFLAAHPEAVVIDQSPVGQNSRSNPATWSGVMDELRKAFAAANKVKPGLFSFNSEGACPACQGLGVTYSDLSFLDELRITCEACGGRRFKEEVLVYKLAGLSISEVLELTVAEALERVPVKAIKAILGAMDEVGLGYLGLGQPLTTLSGGECQRLKIAAELHKAGSLYVLDEPTTGLHMADIGRLISIIDRLVDGGNTVIAIEHNIDVIRSADWLID